jgi:hypothetical protein
MVLWQNLDPRTLLAVLTASVRRAPEKPVPGPHSQAVPVAAGKPVA